MQAKKPPHEISAQYVKGVGPARLKQLNKLGVQTVEGLLYCFPRRYEDRSRLSRIADVREGQEVTIQARVGSVLEKKTWRHFSILRMIVTDDSASLLCVWFNQPYLKNVFKEGQRVILHGKVDRYEVLQLNNPEYEIFKDEEQDPIHTGRIVPVYPATRDLSQRYLRSVLYQTLERYAAQAAETLETNLRARLKLVDIGFALHNIHFPASEEARQRARRRLVFEEFFLLQSAVALRRRGLKIKKGIAHQIDIDGLSKFVRSFGFELTSGQKKAVREIIADMKKDKPMHRLLEGDVGSGKTVVAACALLVAVQNGFQAAVMAPTEILAEQHFMTFSRLFLQKGIDVEILVSGLSPDKKKEIKEKIKGAQAQIVVGTHALLEEDVEFAKLGLVVIDEQHKFGVTQREVLVQKGRNPDVLIMTATPIPRTLAMTVYGDMDISTIRELPPGRKGVVTYWVELERRGTMYSFVKEQLALGRQAYIVYPVIEDSQRDEVFSAEKMYEEFKNVIFKDFRVGLVHGRMSSKEKEKVMKAFKAKKIDVLVSTVVIEVGIDISNATVMVVENADRFGMAQLHQLRGRIGRGEHESFCILLANPKTESASRRLQALSETSDGFEIAECDLEIRGPGDFLGTRQHGLPETRIGSITQDMELLELARREAFALIAKDPDLKEGRHLAIREAIHRRYNLERHCERAVGERSNLR